MITTLPNIRPWINAEIQCVTEWPLLLISGVPNPAPGGLLETFEQGLLEKVVLQRLAQTLLKTPAVNFQVTLKTLVRFFMCVRLKLNWMMDRCTLHKSGSRTLQSVWAVFALSGNIFITSGDWSLVPGYANCILVGPGSEQVGNPVLPPGCCSQGLRLLGHYVPRSELALGMSSHSLRPDTIFTLSVFSHPTTTGFWCPQLFSWTYLSTGIKRAKATCCSLTSKATFLNTGVTILRSPPQYLPRWPETIMEHQSNYTSWWYQQDSPQGKGKTA